METNIQRICNTNRHQDGLAALWKKYEETINNRDRAMTFGRLWEKFLASAYYSDLSQEHKRLSATSKRICLPYSVKVPADSIKPEHIRRCMDKRGEQSKTPSQP